MEEDYEDDDKFGGEMHFGECSTNQVIKFIPVVDLDNSTINVPFMSYQQSLQHLLESYLETTCCQHLIAARTVIFATTSHKKHLYPLN